MKKMNFTVVALSALLVLGSCGTSQKTGTAAGAGAGAALGAIVGGLLNNSHRGTGAAVGAAIGAAVGGTEKQHHHPSYYISNLLEYHYFNVPLLAALTIA